MEENQEYESEKERSNIRALHMENNKGLLGIRRIECQMHGSESFVA